MSNKPVPDHAGADRPESVRHIVEQKARRDAVFTVGDRVTVHLHGTMHRPTRKVQTDVLEFGTNPIFGNWVRVVLLGVERRVTTERVI